MLAYDQLEAGVLFVTSSQEDCFTQLTNSSVRFGFTSEFPSPRWIAFTMAEELHLPIGQTYSRRTFIVSGRAYRYYTLPKGDLEVVVAKSNLILQRRNSKPDVV